MRRRTQRALENVGRSAHLIYMMFRDGLATACLLVTAACGHAPPTPIAPSPSPTSATVAAPPTGLFYPGETMAFEVDYGGIPAGDIAFAVGNLGHDAGRTELVVSSRINSSGVAAMLKHIEDSTTTTVDVGTGRPLVVDNAAEYGDVSGVAHATYLDSIVEVQTKRTSDAKPIHSHFDLHGDLAYDAHTAMAIIRGWHGAAGDHRSVPLPSRPSSAIAPRSASRARRIARAAIARSTKKTHRAR